MISLLIPAAGFGHRMGNPPAKELLIRPNTSKPFIDWPLELALEKNWRALVISREDKTSLNLYIDNYILEHQTTAQKKISNLDSSICNSQIELLKISSSKDWYDTILQSKAHWSERNIVFLPDVDFGPLQILDQLSTALTHTKIAVATHLTNDSQNWGHIYEANKHICFAEKPKDYKIPTRNAWGIFGFQKNAGVKILEAQWQSQHEQKIKTLKTTCSFYSLDFFYDLTRNDKK